MSSDFKSLRRAVRDRIDDLSRYLEIALRGAKITAADAAQITSSADRAATALREVVQKISVADRELMAEVDLRSIHALLDELSSVGIGKGALSIELSLQSRLSLIPSEISVKLKQISGRQRDWDQVDRAIAEGVLLDFVRHNPDKGYWKKFPPFDEDVQADPIDGTNQTWVECEIVAYRHNRWVLCTSFRHVEALHLAPFPEYDEIVPASAAVKLLAAPIALDFEQITWLKKLAGTRTVADSKIQASSVVSPSDVLRDDYHDPDNYWRNVWLYDLRKKGHTNAAIVRQLHKHAHELKFNVIRSPNALNNAIKSIAECHRWKFIRGKPGRPKARPSPAETPQ